MYVELCVRSSSGETNGDAVNDNPDDEVHYVNHVALAAAQEESGCTAGVADKDQSSAVYEDLKIGAGSTHPVVYDTLKPHVKPKPRTVESSA